MPSHALKALVVLAALAAVPAAQASAQTAQALDGCRTRNEEPWGEWPQMVARCTAMIQTNPGPDSLALAYSWRAQASWWLHQEAPAAADIEAAWRVPASGPYKRHVAAVAISLDMKVAEAVALIEQANLPLASPYQATLILGYAKLKRYDDARRLAETLAATPGTGRRQKADKCWAGMVARAEVKRTLQDCREAEDITSLGWALLSVSNWSGALEQFSIQVARDPSAGSYLGQSLAFGKLGRNEEARAALAWAKKLEPKVKEPFLPLPADAAPETPGMAL